MLILMTLKTFFYLPVVDFKKAVDGLSLLVAEAMQLPLSDDWPNIHLQSYSLL